MHLLRFLSQELVSATLAVLLFGSVPSTVSATPFIDPKSYVITKIIPPPPLPGSEEYRIDTGFLKNARATSTKGQIARGNKASNDSVFDYSETLGDWFNPQDLPKTAALFEKVTKETKNAIELAKDYFSRTRPVTWKETGDQEKSNGYAYPSGHTTRAFVWANLLANALPKEQKALHKQGRQKAWYRVILGRHFPADVRAGKLYGQFLAKEFLKSPEFQKVWPEVCQEIISARKAAKQAQVIQPTGGGE
jgi:acid phosphatase (class A)